MAPRQEDPYGRGGSGPSSTGPIGKQPIGVPEGYTAPTPPPWHRGMSALEAGADPNVAPQQTPPRYFDGDQYMPRKFSPAQIWELQKVMAQIGVLTGTFQREIWDENTAKGYAAVLAYANQQGLTEQAALLRMSQGGGTEGSGSRYTVDENGQLVPVGEATNQRPPLVTRTTDPKVLSAVFRKSVVELLGEGWSQQQIDGMAAAYNQMEIARQQEMYDEQLTGGSVVDIPSPEAFIQTQVDEKDPEGQERYQAMQYAGEAAQLLSGPAWGIG